MDKLPQGILVNAALPISMDVPKSLQNSPRKSSNGSLTKTTSPRVDRQKTAKKADGFKDLMKMARSSSPQDLKLLNSNPKTVRAGSLSNLTIAKKKSRSKSNIPKDLIQLNTIKRDLPAIEDLQAEIRQKKSIAVPQKPNDPRAQSIILNRINGSSADNDFKSGSTSARPSPSGLKTSSSRHGVSLSNGFGSGIKTSGGKSGLMGAVKEKINKTVDRTVTTKSSDVSVPGKRINLDKALQNPDFVESNYSSIIQQIMGVNRRKRYYSDSESDFSDMEASITDLRKEEARR